MYQVILIENSVRMSPALRVNVTKERAFYIQSKMHPAKNQSILVEPMEKENVAKQKT